VYRSYDSRVNRTTRRPNFYLPGSHHRDAKVLFPWLNSTKIIFDDKDEHVEPLDAIVDLGINSKDDDVRMLNFIGQVQIISVPYIVGTHIPTHTSQLAAIGRQLQHMHRNEWKHGDLRLCNMVFTDSKDKAYLIDFDFSGKGNVQYPPDFAKYLPDAGVRPVVVGSISAVDDVKAYIRILKMLAQEGGTDPRAFSNAMANIKTHFENYMVLVKQCHDTSDYMGTEYNAMVDKYECEQSDLFLTKAIDELSSTSVDLVVDDEGLQQILLEHNVVNRQKQRTMDEDVKTPERFV
jgi:serine/threonine protein kinase